MEIEKTDSNKSFLQEWDYHKNDTVDPVKLKLKSHDKYWWKCKLGHSYMMTLAHKSSGQGCPVCTGKRVLEGFNDMQTLLPELSSEWDYEKNYPITPKEISSGTSKKYWWRCKQNHSWEASVSHRKRGRGCPYCCGKKVLCGYNDLATTHAHLICEWDNEKNTDFSFHSVSAGSSRSAWWKCSYGHSWKAVISSRATDRRGCPICAKENHTSFPEKAILFYVKQCYPDSISNYRGFSNSKYELDIFIPSIMTGIEYDGDTWHTSIDRDVKKNHFFESHGIRVIRVREPLCPELGTGINIILKDKRTDLENAIRSLCSMILKLDSPDDLTIDIDIERDRSNIYAELITSRKENNFAEQRQELLVQWDHEKNAGLNPHSIKTFSTKTVWWKCQYGHSYTMKVMEKSNGKGCPVCAGRRVEQGTNDLFTTSPQLAEEWDYDKNSISILEVTKYSSKNVWWKCALGHSFRSTVSNRTAGNGCPYCSGKRILPGFNDIGTRYPHLLKEWDYVKNSDISPSSLTPGSHKKVWWKCKTCGYEWNAAIFNRCKHSSGCPQCGHKKMWISRKEKSRKT